jgi:K+/H+ antiporter YhaU regulatory subunit KhtT
VHDVRGKAVIVAVHRADGTVELEPAADAVVEAGDVLVAVGSDEALDALESRFAPPEVEVEESHPAI